MKHRYLIFICTLLLSGNVLFGQCPPPGFPEPGNTCVLAPILCENLDGYCATINNNNQAQQFPGCPGWQLNNDEWFAFFAGTTSITIQVTPSNCSGGQPGLQGLQGGIYAGCGPPWVAKDLQCACTINPFILTSNSYVVGEVYYFVLDGCQGQVCDYSIDVLDGSTVGVAPADPGPITGSAIVCQPTSSTYSLAEVPIATNYNWQLNPPIGTIQSNNQTAVVSWNDTLVGTAELCVLVANGCFGNPTPSCITISRMNTPILDLGPDIIVCTDTIITLNAGPGFISYQWQDGSNLPAYQLTTPGTYWVEVTDTCGAIQRDSVFFTISLLPDTRFADVVICPGDSAIFSAPGFSIYSWAPGSGLSCTNCPSISATPAVSTLYTLLATDSVGCLLQDTFIVTPYQSPILDLGPDVILCNDSTVTFNAGSGFVSYLWQDSSALATYTTASAGVYWVVTTDSCGLQQRDSILFSVSLLTDTQFPDAALCLGDTKVFAVPGFSSYNWAPATGLSCTNCPIVTAAPVVTTEYTLLATDTLGCVLRDTFVVTVSPLPTKTVEIEFCPGNSVSLNGVNYAQPTTVLNTIPASGAGCDTLVTYHLQFVSLPQPSTVDIQCPASKTVVIAASATQALVSYDAATSSTDCPCGETDIQRTQGPASGTNFPVGNTQICYLASDSCGNTNSCCFNITVENEPGEDPCDVKNTTCVKFELLDIFQNPAKQKTYRMRVTNTCTNKLVYVAYQLPNGVVADKPLNGTIYTTPSGRSYEVRNPNYTPTYSIRFKSAGSGIANGQSDIFEYTLPPQADPTFIHAVARLEPQIYYETHLNVFYCPIQQTLNKPGDAANEDRNLPVQKTARIYPNPASDLIFVDLSAFEQETIYLKVTDALGRTLENQRLEANADPFELRLPKSWPAGIYQLEIIPSLGVSQTLRFVVER